MRVIWICCWFLHVPVVDVVEDRDADVADTRETCRWSSGSACSSFLTSADAAEVHRVAAQPLVDRALDLVELVVDAASSPSRRHRRRCWSCARTPPCRRQRSQHPCRHHFASAHHRSSLVGLMPWPLPRTRMDAIMRALPGHRRPRRLLATPARRANPDARIRACRSTSPPAARRSSAACATTCRCRFPRRSPLL